MPGWKKLLFALLPALALLLLLELAGRAYYFQRNSARPFYIAEWIAERRGARLERKAEAFVAEMRPQTAKSASQASPEDRENYLRIFNAFAALCQDRGVALFVVHAPDPWTPDEDREFFRRVCAQASVPILDLSEAFSKYPVEATHLMPLDAHPSMFGHRLIADAVAAAIRPSLGLRAPDSEPLADGLLGDCEPLARTVIWGGIPCWRTINSQGLRSFMTGEEPNRKERVYAVRPDPAVARVLCIGDSFTFGSFVNDEAAWPYVLGEKLAQAGVSAEVINAGHEGYAICDEYAYLADRGMRLSPDIVVLQVLNNDVYKLAPSWQKEMCRHVQGHQVASPGKFCYGAK